MAPHSSTLAWKIPWTEEPGRLQSMGSLRVRHDWVTSLSLFTLMHWRRKWQPTPVFLPGESQGRGSLVGCRLWGRTESDMTEVTAASAAIDWLFITSMNYHCLSRFLHSKQAHPLESPSSISFTTVPGSDAQNVANLTFNTQTKSISECQFSYNSILGIFFFF